MSNLAKLNQFKRYLRNSAGSIAPIFALAAIPFLMVAGAAVDMTRASREHTTFNGAVDAAALAIAADDRSALSKLANDAAKETRRAELELYAEKYLSQNYSDASGANSTVTATLTITDQDLKLETTLEFPTTFMSLVGIKKMTLKSDATIKKAARPVELVLIMDTTGSMASDMATAKASTKKLIKKLYGDQTTAAAPASEFIRTALVPFSAAVRINTAGPDYNLNWFDTTGANPISKLNFNELSGAPAVWNNYYAWSRLKKSSSSNHTWNGCVEMRKRGTGSNPDYMFSDVEPVSTNADSLFPVYFSPDTPSFTSQYKSATGADVNYPVPVRGVTFSNSYIPEDATATSETAGLTIADKTYTELANTNAANWDTNTTNLLATLRKRQENWRKYDGRNIGNESASSSGPWSNCTRSAIVPMTYDRSKVEAGIDAMTANGPTNIPEGLSWGRRVISPSKPFTKVQGFGSAPETAESTISEYGSPKWQKIAVLMTDGENNLFTSSGYQVDPNNVRKPGESNSRPINHSGTWYSSYGRGLEPSATNRLGITDLNDAASHTAKMNDDIATICTQMKADGITIYTTTFRVTDPTVQERVKNCATSAIHYKHSESAVDLDVFFSHIGETVNKAIYVSK
jgi:Flp pilus assembly protein TadG